METRAITAAVLAVGVIAGCAGAAAPPTPAASPTPVTAASPTRRTSTPPPTPAATAVTPLNETTTAAGTTQPAGSTKVRMVRLDFEPANVRVRAGKVVIYLVNDSQFAGAHNMAISASRGSPVLARSDLLSPRQAAVFTVSDLRRGNYYIFCEVVPHERHGMFGTLTVR